jgi:glycolate oxidase iron-sulfur subunit
MASNPQPSSQVRPLAPEIHRAPAQPVRDVVDYELLFDCVHCGLCLEACPTYVLTRAEMDSPRGRIYLMKALAEGTLELDADAVRHLDLCLECRGCETACPSGVRYGKLIEKARVYIERNWRRDLRTRVRNRIIAAIFPHAARLRILLAPLKLLERVGLRPLLRRIAPSAIGEWLDLLPPLARDDALVFPPSMLHGGADGAPGAGIHEDEARRPSALVHHGCVAQVLCEAENLNSECALDAAGYRVLRLDATVCCGALDIHNGNRERALELARANVRALAASGAGAIVSAASGCSAVIASYGDLLKDDPELAATARAVSARAADLSALVLAAKNPFTREFRATVTYHDACHLVHGMGVREAPRELLRSIPGVRLVELAESDLCCGSAGSYNLTEPAMAHELARRKAGNIIATGADYVVLANPGCEFQIAAELRRQGARTRVIHLADFLALVAGGSVPRP